MHLRPTENAKFWCVLISSGLSYIWSSVFVFGISRRLNEENLKNVGYQPNLYTTNLMQEISILIPRLKYLGNLFWPT